MNACATFYYKINKRSQNYFGCVQKKVVMHNTSTVFLLKIRHGNNNIALASPNFQRLIFNVLSACAFHSRLIAYMYDDLCRKIRDYIQSFGKGCRIIRRAEFLEEIRYLNVYNDHVCNVLPAGRVQVRHLKLIKWK